jgi:hypothetical protein
MNPYIILEEEVFYGTFAYMLEERVTLDETLMTWKNIWRISM